MAEDQQLSPEAAELNRRRASAQIRAKVATGQLIDHLNDCAALATLGDPEARFLCQQLLNALDGVRSAAVGIALARGGQ